MGYPNIGVIGTPGSWSSEALADAIESASGFRLLIDPAELCAHLDTGRLFFHDWDLARLDAIVVRRIGTEDVSRATERLQMLRLLDSIGIRCFSPVERMLPLMDRLSCTLSLREAGIPIPETRLTESASAAAAAVWDFGSALFKPILTDSARAVTLIDSEDDPAKMQQAIEAFRGENPLMLIQKRRRLPGRDLGMVFIGGEYLGAYARVGRVGAWNTAIVQGGHYERHDASEELVALGHRIQAHFGLDFTSIDLAETEQGPVVWRVSPFGGFHGAVKGLGVDVAARFADYLMRAMAT